MNKKETIIVSLGGSLVAPDKIDLGFLKNLKNLILSNIKKHKFVIFVGGGKIARLYQNTAVQFGADNNTRDWLGINVSRLNAEIVKSMFKNAYPKIINDPTKKISADKDIVVGAGWKPGWSTDYVAVMAAKKLKAKTIVNLTNIDYVYTKDPRKFPDAKPLKEITWKDFKKLVGSKWVPGLSAPFDPIASKLAEKLRLTVVIINGRKLERLNSFLNNKQFIGTTIK